MGQDGRPQQDSAVWWSSSNPDVVTVTGDGWVRAVFPGEAVLTASAGSVSTRVHVRVRGAAAHPGVESSPGPSSEAQTVIPEATSFFRPENFGVTPAPPSPPAPPPGTEPTGPHPGRELAPATFPVPTPAPAAQETDGPDDPIWLNPTARMVALGVLGLIIGFGLFRAFSGGGDGGALQASLAPGDTTVSVGDAFQARLSAGQDVAAAGVQWSSSDNSVITVSETGLARARTPGTAEISVRGADLSGTVSMVVNVMPSASGAVAVILGPTEVVVGGGVATYQVQSAEGQTQGGDVSWSVDRADLATVSQTGELTPRASGTVRLTALVDGEAVVLPLEILPATEEVVVYRDIQIGGVPNRITSGASVRPRAVLVDSQGRSQASGSVQWTSSNAAVLRQTGAASFEAVAAGQSSLEVYSPTAGLRRSLTVTVVAAAQPDPDPVEPEPDPVRNDPVATQVRIAPREVAFGIGGSQALAATVLDQEGQPIPSSPVEWVSRDPAIVTVTGGGNVSGQAPGSTHVIGRTGSVLDSVLVRVTAAAPTSDDLMAGARSCVGLMEAEDAQGLRSLMTNEQAQRHAEFLSVVENGRLTPNGDPSGLTGDGNRATFALPVRHRTGFGANREGTMQFQLEMTRQGETWGLAACSPTADAALP